MIGHRTRYSFAQFLELQEPMISIVLLGKYGVGVRPESGRLVENAQYQKRYGDAVHWETADQFKAFAAARGYQPAALAVAWVMSHPAITAPIIGVSKMAQLEDALGALDVELSPAEIEQLEAPYQPHPVMGLNL